MLSAGDRATAARLFRDYGSLTYATFTPSSVGVYETWDAATLDFVGYLDIPCDVKAYAIGRTSKTTAGVVAVDLRVGISIDGGTTYTYGPTLSNRAGNSVGASMRMGFMPGHARGGVVPTGTIKVRTQVKIDVAGASVTSGILLAKVVPL